MKTPFFVNFPTPFPPTITEDDRKYNQQHQLSPGQKTFLSGLIIQVKKKYHQLLLVMLGFVVLLIIFNFIASPLAILRVRVDQLLFYCVCFLFYGFWQTRTLLNKLLKDELLHQVQPIVLKKFRGWRIGTELSSTLLRSSLEEDTRSGVRYMLPNSRIILAVDTDAPLTPLQQEAGVVSNPKKLLWDTFSWIVVRQIVIFAVIAGFFLFLSDTFALPFLRGPLAVIGGMIGAAFVRLDFMLPSAALIVKDILAPNIITVSGYPSDVKKFQRRRAKHSGYDMYTTFTIAQHTFTVEDHDFVVVEADKKYQIQFFQNSELIVAIHPIA